MINKLFIWPNRQRIMKSSDVYWNRRRVWAVIRCLFHYRIVVPIHVTWFHYTLSVWPNRQRVTCDIGSEITGFSLAESYNNSYYITGMQIEYSFYCRFKNNLSLLTSNSQYAILCKYKRERKPQSHRQYVPRHTSGILNKQTNTSLLSSVLFNFSTDADFNFRLDDYDEGINNKAEIM